MSLDPRVLAAGIQGGFSLLGSGLNYFSQKEVLQKQIDMMREQNKFQEYMTNKQNLWNSEPAQMNRIAQAGLNPALAFGDSSSGGVASVSSPPNLQAPQVDFSDVGLSAAQAFGAIAAGTKDSEEAKGINIDNMTRNAMNQKQLEHIDSILQSEEINRSLSRMQRSMVKSQRDWVNFQLRLGNATFDSQVESRTLQNLETKARTEMIKEQGLNFAADTAYKKSMTVLNNIEAKFRPAQLQASISEAYSRIENMAAMNQVSYAEASKIYKEAVWQEFANQDSAIKLEVYKKSLPFVMKGWQQQQDLLSEEIKNARVGRYGQYADMLWKPVDTAFEGAKAAGLFYLGGRSQGMFRGSTPKIGFTK